MHHCQWNKREVPEENESIIAFDTAVVSGGIQQRSGLFEWMGLFPQVGEVKIHAVEAKAVIQIDAFAERYDPR